MKKFSLRLVKEQEVEYRVGAITDPEKIDKLGRDVLELDQMTEECFCIVAMDTKLNVIGTFEVSRGTVSASLVHPREVFKRALLCNASAIILLHNHPSGDPTPSNADIEVTIRLQEAGEILGVDVLDHIIIGDGYVSLKEEKVIE